MSTQVQHRRGTAVQHESFTGAMSEITHDTTNNNIRVHDGVKAGGYRTLMEQELGVANGIATLDSSGMVPEAQLGNVPKSHDYASTIALAEAEVPAAITYVRTAGYYAPGDGGAALYKRVDEEPTHAGKVQSADGAWWELDEKSTIDIRVMGAVAGQDCSASINDAVTFLGGVGVVVIPSGDYYFDSDISLGSNRITLRGDGVAASRLISRNGSEIQFNGTPGEFNGSSVIIRDLTILTSGVYTHDVVNLSFTGGSGGTDRSVIIQNVDVRAFNAGSSFRSAISLNNSRNSLIDNVSILGGRDAAPIVSQYGVRAVGDSDPVDTLFRKVHCYFVQIAFDISGSFEGTTFDNITVVACRQGVSIVSPSGIEPLVTIHDSHINTSEVGVSLQRQVQFNIHDNLFYYQESDGVDTGYVGIIVSDITGPAHSFIKDNNFQGLGAGAKNAIHVADTVNSSGLFIDGNIFSGFDSALINSGTGAVFGSKNSFFSVTQHIALFSGSVEKVYKVKMGRSVITLNSNGDGTIHLPDLFQYELGRVDGFGQDEACDERDEGSKVSLCLLAA